MAGRPKTRERQRRANNRPKYPALAAIYAERYSSFDALRTAMVQSGIVDHGINPYEVIQRAIDDTTFDYLLIRKQIDKDTHGDPYKITAHPLYDHMEHIREATVRYSSMAMQYDIARRQLRLSESRIALLAHTLKEVLPKLGVTQEQIKQVPQLLIEQLHHQQPTLDETKATALAEILGNDAEIVIEDKQPNASS